MVNTPVFTHRLRRRRDLLAVRQRARQTAGLLGFSATEQHRIAAAVFEVACGVFGTVRHVSIQFAIEGQTLRVCPVVPDAGKAGQFQKVGKSLRLERALSPKGASIAPEDLAWALHELARLTPLDVFEEIVEQNRELLLAHQELLACRAELERLSGGRKGSNAA